MSYLRRGSAKVGRPEHGSAVAFRKRAEALEESVVDTINELSNLAKKLNKKSDTLNATITTINGKLAKLNLGTEVWMPMEEGDPYYRESDDEERFPMREETWLGYCKVNDEWELALKEVTVGTDDQGERFADVLKSDPVRPLLQSSRENRVGAMKLIPRLLDAIEREAKYLLDTIDEAEKAAEKL